MYIKNVTALCRPPQSITCSAERFCRKLLSPWCSQVLPISPHGCCESSPQCFLSRQAVPSISPSSESIFFCISRLNVLLMLIGYWRSFLSDWWDKDAPFGEQLARRAWYSWTAVLELNVWFCHQGSAATSCLLITLHCYFPKDKTFQTQTKS